MHHFDKAMREFGESLNTSKALPEDVAEIAARRIGDIMEESNQFFVSPHSDIIVVEQEVQQYSRGGICLPGDEAKRLHYGTIVACGPGRVWDGTFVPMGYKVGQRIVWGKYSSGGEPMTHEGKEYILLRENDIIGVMNVPAYAPALAVAA